jgi:anaerobic selenocysteine-containing dehydrogenase
VGDQPVQLSGVAGHPLSHGALCTFGLAGHHLPYHPARLKQGPLNEATVAVTEAIAKTGASEHVVTLDLRPSRTASWTHRRAMAAIRNGIYATASASSSAAVDLSKARTVISFGVPLLDGWGTPGNVNAARSSFRLIQVDPLESRTASMADWWLRVRPGSEDMLAQALAGTVGFSAAAEAAGIAESDVAALAVALKQDGPVLVLGTSRLESTGQTVVARHDTPVPAEWQKQAAAETEWATLADGSVRVLLIDESAPGEYLPWNVIEKKLVADNPVVVAFAWSREGYGRHAQYVLPVGVYPEVADDIPPAIDSTAATFRIAAPLVAAPAGVVKPEEFVAKLAGLSIGDPLRERADAIHKAGRGSLFTYADAKSAPIQDVKADDFWKVLNAGACWIDAPDEKAAAARLPVPTAPARSADEPELPLVVALSHELTPASPILSKVYQESNLRLAPNRVALHPSCGLEDGAQATLQTVLGKCAVAVTLDAGVPVGMVQVSASPAILDLCAAGARAKVVRS